MNTLVGQTIRHANGYGTFIKVLSETEDGTYYNCIDLSSGRRFQTLKEVYNRIFLPRIREEIKPKGTKGDNPNYLSRK